MVEPNSNEPINDAEAMTDRISTLPDHLLCDILSFLPTKLAATTSVLSKSWKSLWLSLPSLDLDDGIDDPSLRSSQDLQDNYAHFTRFVDWLLIPRLDQPIQRFRFECAFCSNPFDINIWVNIVMGLNVEELDISLPFRNGILLASNLFFSKAIVVLKLKNVTVINLSSISLPSLKILHLENVPFPDYECVSRLLSTSKGLEDLVLKSIHVRTRERNLIKLAVSNFSSVSLLSLKTLRLENIAFPDCECISKLLSCCIAVEDLVLKYIYITTNEERKWHNYESFPKLVRAKIHCVIPLRVFYNVKFLQLWQYLRYDSADTPTFYNLVSLEVILSNCNWKILECMLPNSPMLQNLVVHERYRFEHFNFWKNPERVPGCISSHLKTCCLRGFDYNYTSTLSGLPFAVYIVENARVLQTMTFFATNPITKNMIIQKMSSCRRRSPTCELFFE